MTKKQIKDRVVAQVGLEEVLDYDEGVFVEEMIYQGTLDVLSRTRCVVRCLHLKTKANVSTYTLSHDVLGLVDVEDGNMRRRRRDETDDGFTLIRADVLRVTPTPSEDGEIDVWAVLRPQKMTQDGDDLGAESFGAIPPEYQDAVITYALWKGAEFAHEQVSGYGERYRVLYEGQDGRGGRLSQIRLLVNKRGTARAPRRRVILDPGASPRHSWVS